MENTNYLISGCSQDPHFRSAPEGDADVHGARVHEGVYEQEE